MSSKKMPISGLKFQKPIYKSHFRDYNASIKSRIRDFIGGVDVVLYPILIGEMAKRGIKKKDVALCIGVCSKALSNKIKGKTSFTWPEVTAICKCFFPDLTPDAIFSTNEQIVKKENQK